MLKVLIADDKPSVCSGLMKAIPWKGLNAEVVAACGNGREALRLAAEHRPDLIITDIRMPVMDGLELCDRASSLVPDAVFIILSAFDDFAYAQTAIRHGVSDYILKPIDKAKLERLTSKIAEIADRRRVRERYMALLYDASVKERLAAGIRRGETAELAEQFESVCRHAGAADFRDVRDIGCKLLALLFDILREADLSPEQMGISREAAWQRLVGAANGEGMLQSVRMLYESAAEWIRDRKDARGEAVAERIKSLIRGRYADPDLTIYSIAEELSLSPNYVSAVFRRWTSDNISLYIVRLRMEHARRRLKHTADSVQEIAAAVGYSDAHYFAKVFKKWEGLTPSQYRNAAARAGAEA